MTWVELMQLGPSNERFSKCDQHSGLEMARNFYPKADWMSHLCDRIVILLKMSLLFKCLTLTFKVIKLVRNGRSCLFV